MCRYTAALLCGNNMAHTRRKKGSFMRIRSIASRIIILACVACVSMILLASCSSSSQGEEDIASLNRAYMSSVNRISNEAAEDLDSFSEAASQGDVAAMRIAAANATETLSKISDLTAPDDLSEVHEEYLAGVTDLSEALENYVELYASAVNASSDSDDASDVTASIDEEALTEVQEQYQSGIDHLSTADSMVAEIAGNSDDDDSQSEDESES